MRALSIVMGAITTFAASAALAQSPPRIVSEDMMVPAVDAGIEIFVRNKRPADMTAFRPERTVLYVHGATYPPAPRSTSSSMACRGWITSPQRGYDVYLLDLRGYGKSTRPKEM